MSVKSSITLGTGLRKQSGLTLIQLPRSASDPEVWCNRHKIQKLFNPDPPLEHLPEVPP
jgi:hypothetical protein